MKTIGLLGGTSWPSTIDYYRILNKLAQERLGGFHSASILLRSIDYHDIKSRYYERWAEIPALLEQEIKAFVGLGPDCLVICNNTLHKAFDAIEAKLELTIPVFHIVKATGRIARSTNMRRLLLLGTKFTMEDGFYHRGLEHSVSGLRRLMTRIAPGFSRFSPNWQGASCGRSSEGSWPISLRNTPGWSTESFLHVRNCPWP